MLIDTLLFLLLSQFSIMLKIEELTLSFSELLRYKNYYHSMYDKYFYSKNVDKGLLSSNTELKRLILICSESSIFITLIDN